MRRIASPAPRHPGVTTLQAALGLTLMGLLFRGLLAGDCLLQADLHQLFEPLRQVSAAAVREGRLTWTPAMGNGSPLLGNPLHGLAYPPNWLCLLLEPARALSLLCALHLAWGAVGTWLLAAERGAGLSARWLAAVAFALSGVGLSAALIPNLGWPLAWLPWLVLAHARMRRRRRSLAPVLALAVSLAVLLVLAEPTLLFAGLAWIAIAECRVLLRTRGRRWPWRTVLAGLLGLGLASPAVGPVVRTVAESVRSSGFEREGMLQWSMHPLETLAWVAPGAFGSPNLHGLQGHWARTLWPARESGLYHGTYWGGLLLALAAAGACTTGRRREELLAWLALLLLLALGRHGPIFPWLSGVPLADSWRYPAKWLTPACLPVALLAARGLDNLRRKAARRALLLALALTGLVCATLALGSGLGVAGGLWRLLGAAGEPPPWLAARLSSAGWMGLLPLLLAALALSTTRRELRLPPLAPTLAGLVTAALIVSNAGLVPTVPLSAFRHAPAAVEVLRAQRPPVGRLWVQPAKDLRWSDEPRTRAEYHRWERDSLRLYMAASFGLPLSFHVDFEAMSPFDYARLGQMIATAPEREQLMLLGAAGVTHLASFEERDPRWATQISAHDVRTDRPLRLFANRLALPRARIVTELIPYSSDEELYRRIAGGPDELFARAAFVTRGELPSTPVPAVAIPGSVAVRQDDGAELVLSCSGDGGFLIVSDPLVEGWAAELDGAPIEMFRADVAFRGLVLPAGEHQVRMLFSAW